MATKKSTTTQSTARTVYESPEGRVKVVREGNKDYALYCDTFFVKSYEYAFQAEHAGGVWLHEQAAQLAADLADEQADKDAEAERDAFNVALALELVGLGILTPDAETVRIQQTICEDTVNTALLGKPLGTEFIAGGPDNEVMAYISDTDPHYRHIDVFMFGRDPIHIEELEAAMPALLAILADPRFQAARAAKEAEWAAEKAA